MVNTFLGFVGVIVIRSNIFCKATFCKTKFLGWIDNGYNPLLDDSNDQILLSSNHLKPDCRKDTDGNYYFDFHIFVNEVNTGYCRVFCFVQLFSFFLIHFIFYKMFLNLFSNIFIFLKSVSNCFRIFYTLF